MEEKQPSTEKQWLIEINQEFMVDSATESAHWAKKSIYKIPAAFTDLNERAYKPQIVSIGPYHHCADHLKAMEQHKHRALSYFLKRSKKCLKTLVDLLTPEAEDVKDAYDQLDSKWHQNTGKFLEMIIYDGCFILEILRKTTDDKCWKKSQNEAADDYASNDPIFSKHGELNIVPYLKRDMLMLENQIPMLVLEKLAEDVLQGDKGLTELVFNFLFPEKTAPKVKEFPNCVHILDVYYRSLLLEEPSPGSGQKIMDLLAESCQKIMPRQCWSFKCSSLLDKIPRDQKGGSQEGIVRSATELQEAGIRIEPSKSGSLKDISFRHGVLKLPVILVDDALESLYLNLIAYERFHVGATNEVTSYVFFMDNIIENATDVSLLHSCGIIQNALGSDKAVAKLFNSLSREATLDRESSLHRVHGNVSAYCQKRWHRWKAYLKHNYCLNPCITASVIAAIFLFALAILQTVFSVLAYVKPPPSA